MYVAIYDYGEEMVQVAGPFSDLKEAERFRSEMYDIDSGEYFIGDIELARIRNPAEVIEELRKDVGDNEYDEDEH